MFVTGRFLSAGAVAMLWSGGGGKEKVLVVFSVSWEPRQDPLGVCGWLSLLAEQETLFSPQGKCSEHSTLPWAGVYLAF